ncbi:TRZ/ATZ family hydrolase [Thiolapillus brandeum]|uniref:5-methylthioadenosine/S-adenosylhomocysteine deaminase n=1 Tax=Thiolapillus brandeum TaxID=1076588 RepID=A0A7U6GJW2_9GAMM|nr:TRZ/ATZ family hydrolase [Thiolapillus brandeum]BAO45048.1 N-ethylammeline chlorohydrolase [Thiolapillus brandeum]
MQADILIHARWIIPVEPPDQVLDHHALAIHQGRISAILPSAQAREQITAERVVELPDHALIPGLINAHTHTPMNLFRGMADDLPLMDWLTRHIWPAEQRWISPEFVADGSRLAMAEMIRSGTTCFNDMYFFPDVTGQVAQDAGIRAVLGMILIDFPSAWATDSDDYLDKALKLHDQFRNEPLIKAIFAPHAPYSVSDAPLQRVRTLANELDLPIHMHVHETADEISQSLEQFGQRPLARLEALNLPGPDFIAVHMTQLQDQEIERFAASGSHVVHCPESNLKLASGFCPVAQLLEAGVNVALGTDGAASNNDLDMLGEMKTAALLGKGVAQNPEALPAARVLAMATINAARALGLEQETGSLKTGKAADITAIDLGPLETRPLFDPVSHIVYAAGREQVSDVWVNGCHLLQERTLMRMDHARLLANAGQWQEKLIEWRQSDAS